jgi:hypothetical protein
MRNGRCRMHGGKSPQGIASATLKDGRYSRHLPTRMLTAYDESRRDPNLLALDQEVSLVDSRLAELLAKVDTGESSATVKAAYASWQSFKAANRRKDADAAKVAADEHDQAISHLFSAASAWDDIFKWIEQRRKLTDSEQKRRTAGQELMTAEQAMLLVTALTQAVRDHVRDPDALANIAADLDRIAPWQTPRRDQSA